MHLVVRFHIVIIGQLRITKHPDDGVLNIFNGDEQVVLVCEAVGDGIVSTEWKRENQPVTTCYRSIISQYNNNSAVTSTLTITNAQPSDSGRYHCVVSNQWLEVISESAQVTVKSMCINISINFVKKVSYFIFTCAKTFILFFTLSFAVTIKP